LIGQLVIPKRTHCWTSNISMVLEKIDRPRSSKSEYHPPPFHQQIRLGTELFRTKAFQFLFFLGKHFRDNLDNFRQWLQNPLTAFAPICEHSRPRELNTLRWAEF